MINKALKVGKLNQLVPAIMPISVTFKPEGICSTPAFSIALCESSTYMYRYLFVALILLFFVNACRQKVNNRTVSNKDTISSKAITQETNTIVKPPVVLSNLDKAPIDTLIILFNDSTYRLYLHKFDEDNDYDETKPNTTLTFRKGDSVIFKERVFCMSWLFEFEDIDNDKVKDLLLFSYSGARANPSYYLYLAKGKKLIKVKDFEELPNPNVDTTNHIITGNALYGDKAWVDFYRITKTNKLIKLGPGLETDSGDSSDVSYQKTLKQIIKKWGNK
jgi:hypothetical protein